MNYHVEKSSFLNQYPDKEAAGKKEPENPPHDPLVTPGGECRSCLKELTTNEVLSLVVKCADFAAKKHARQRRKDLEETPYINHPIGVANILTSEAGVYDSVVVLAALLHDTVEDTETTFEEIEKEFGKTVREVVAEVTDDKNLEKSERKRLQIVNAKNRSHRAKLVALADKIYNLRDLQKGPPVGWSDTRVREYFQWAKKVVDNSRGTNEAMELILDHLFAKQCKDSKKKCNCSKKVSPTCAEEYLCNT